MKEKLNKESILNEEDFRATIKPDGAHLILTNGRITGILKGIGTHDELLRLQYPSKIRATDTILAFYVQGTEYVFADRKTADGQCIFFLFDEGGGHEKLEKKDEFKVKGDTSFYYKIEGSNQYCRTTFASFTGIATDDDLASTSSTKTGHKNAGLNLLPRG